MIITVGILIAFAVGAAAGCAAPAIERLLEVVGRHTAQIENRQRVDALGSPRPLRQDRRGETGFLIRLHHSPVAQFNPGLDAPARRRPSRPPPLLRSTGSRDQAWRRP
jgi:hypothetical protein